MGIQLARALALEGEGIPVDQWNKTLEKYPRIARAYEQKVAQIQLEMLENIKAGGMAALAKGNLPVGLCWLLERGFPGEYGKTSTTEHKHSGTVVLGVQEGIRQRATAYSRGLIQEPKQLKRGKGKAKLIDLPPQDVTLLTEKDKQPPPQPADTQGNTS